jgi:DNA repair exonuclease SbcCD nuclease subunit
VGIRPFRFIHTADWQIGLRVRFIPGDDGAEVREARLKTVRRIAELAERERAELVVVAGDVFEHHGLKPSTVRRAFDVLGEFPVPVYLLPGNHDPLTPDSLYRSELWRREAPPNVHVLGSTAPVPVRDGVVLLPCPLVARHTLEDPTAHLTPGFGPADAIRVAVAHGGILEILQAMADEEYQPANAIGRDVARRGELDYVALGDWHGRLAVDARTAYSGTPEATRFKEKDPGHALVVEIGAHGAAPQVEAHEVSTLRWVQPGPFTIDGPDDLARLEAFLDAVPRKGETLLELALVGTIDAALRDRLEAEVLGRARDRLRWLRVRDEGLHTYVREEDLQAIGDEGSWLQAAVQALRAPDVPRDEAERALRLLYRLHRDVAR